MTSCLNKALFLIPDLCFVSNFEESEIDLTFSPPLGGIIGGLYLLPSLITFLFSLLEGLLGGLLEGLLAVIFFT